MNDIRSAPVLQNLTLALYGPATVAAGLAIADPNQSLWRTLLTALGYWTSAAALNLFLRRRPDWGVGSATGRLSAFWLFLFVSPFVWEPLRRGLLDSGDTCELLLLASFRNLGLGLAAFSARPKLLPTAGVAALFLMLFAAVLTEGPLIALLLGLYTLVATLWVMQVYWVRVKRRFPGDARGSLPPVVVAVLACLLAMLAVFVEVGPKHSAALLGQLMPSSGGTKLSDRFARGGVGDGDNLVNAVKQAMSVAPVDSDVFLETHERSMDDVVSETLGEPRKPKTQRSVARSAMVQKAKSEPAEALKAGRQFATLRETPRQREAESTRASGVLYVEGPTPVHLPLRAYAEFDGSSWIEDRTPSPSLELREYRDGWLGLKETNAAPFAGVVSHRIKFAGLKTNVVVAPPLLEAFKLGQGYPADFFKWSSGGVIRLQGDEEVQVPLGSVVNASSRTIDPALLRTVEFPLNHFHALPIYTQSSRTNSSPGWASLAMRWTQGVPRGWRQVEAVVNALRSGYTLDPLFRLPDCDEPIAYFLEEGKRGQDYHFASAAVLLLRSLDYPSRLVSGFYASPANYDSWSRQTIVRDADVHFWAEVHLPNAGWVPIEPSPGYDLLPPARDWWSRTVAAVTAMVQWTTAHWPGVGIGLFGLLIAWLRRAYLADLAATCCWRLQRSPDRRRRVLQTVRLLEFRAKWARCARPKYRTLAAWYQPIAAAKGEAAALAMRRFLVLAAWAFYSPAKPAPANDASFDACNEVAARFTLFRLQHGR